MANERKQMFELGEWLEKYLEPGITSKEYMSLGYFAKDYYGLEFETTKDDLSFQAMKIFDSSPLKLLRYSDLEELFNSIEFCILEAYGGRDKEMITIEEYSKNDKEKDFLSKLHKLYIDFQTPYINLENDKKLFEVSNYQYASMLNHTISYKSAISGLENFIEETLYDFIICKFMCIEFFYNIQNSSKEWTETLNSKYANSNELDLFNSRYGADYFLERYSVINKSCYIEKGHFKRSNVLTGDYNWFTKFRWSTSDIHNYPSIFPWGVIVAKIFLDFLILGGQNHFKFCENCGNFTIIKRKNKQYCSDRCRTEFNRVSKLNRS